MMSPRLPQKAGIENVWSERNPYLTASRTYYHRFFAEVWTGIIGDQLVGPYLLPNALRGIHYHVFIEQVFLGIL